MLTAEEQTTLLQQARQGHALDAARARDLALDLADQIQAARDLAQRASFELDQGKWRLCRKTLDLIQHIA